MSSHIYPSDILSPQYFSDECPPTEDRNEFVMDWTCDDFADYAELQETRMYVSYSVKGIQIAVFTWLLIILTYRRCKDVGNKYPILICVLAILNGCFAMIRVDAIDPVTDNDWIDSLQTETGYEVIFCLESICFVGAMWFYSIKYYETAQVLKHFLSNTEQRSQYLTP